MEVHLQFMAFLLQDGALYLPNKRASEVWETLISNPNACQDDRTVSCVNNIHWLPDGGCPGNCYESNY